ncbi:MAG: PD40 domain-containing protein [Chthonomonas sp.]|nr:PD40 domain-containing protein [Chthonomonas sp.]
MKSKTLLVLALSATSIVAVAQEMKLLRFPTVHGNKVAFMHGSDLWVTDLAGGPARRLTSHTGVESRPVFSPDGSMIAFTGMYDGAVATYVVSSEGGDPKRISWDGRGNAALFWKDNKTVAIRQAQDGFTMELQFVDVDGGFPMETPIKEITSGDISADGTWIAYNRNNSWNFNWRYYRGGTQGVVTMYNFNTKTYSELPHGLEQNYHPMIVGRDIYYISDRDLGTLNLYKYNLDSKRAERLTDFSDKEIRFPRTDGKTIVFERGAGLYSFDIGSRAIKPIVPRIAGDLNLRRPSLKKVNTMMSGITLSPSGKRVAISARGDIFSVPRTGDTRNLTDTQGIREENPNWSPDGQSIAYVTDQSGEAEIWTMDSLGGNKKKVCDAVQSTSMAWSADSKNLLLNTFDNKLYMVDVATGKMTKIAESGYGVSSPEFSPLGDYVAYINTQANLFGAVNIYDVKSGKTHKVSDAYFNDSSLSWDQNGKYLYVTSQREYAPTLVQFEQTLDSPPLYRVYAHILSKKTPNPLAPRNDEEPIKKPAVEAPKEAPKEAAKDEPKEKRTEIDFDGLGKRAVVLPWAPGATAGVIGVDNGVIAGTAEGLMMFSFASRQAFPVLQAQLSGLTFNADRNKLAWMAGPNAGIADVAPNVNPATTAINLAGLEMTVDPVKEWTQIINETWRLYRDRFYQADMVGINWEEVKDRYMPLVKYASSRDDINYIMGMMIGEVGTGHAYNGGGEASGTAQMTPVGYLGADYELVGNAVKIRKVLQGDGVDMMTRGPLTEPGADVNAGDYLVAIDGKPVNRENPPMKYLQNKAGKMVYLSLNSKPSMDGARKVGVRAIPNEDALRYQDWVEENRKKVEKLSGGRIGYVHVPDTQVDGMIGFLKGYYSQSDKEALVIDERFNGGGFIPTFFVERLKREVQSGFKARNGDVIAFPTQSNRGPTAMLINEYAGSGGDMFPYLYKINKVGKIFGTRTWGGLVGIQGNYPLVDGGMVTVPGFGIYDLQTGKWVAENTGVEPDVRIDGRPDWLAQGKDEVLEAAVKHLLAELKKNPVKPLKAPVSPRVRPGQSRG